MRRTLAFLLFGALAASVASAEYTVVLKDGRRLAAKSKWTVVQGKAIVELTNGTRLQLDPASIDVQKSEEATRSGLGDVKVLKTVPQTGTRPAQESATPLGSLATIRRPSRETPAERPAGSGQQTPASSSAALDTSVAAKFKAGFENVGLFDAQLSASAPNRLRIDVTADNEDQVFKAISATSFIFANVPSSYEVVELFMKTNNGGSAGRFQMTMPDARALANKQMEWYDYFVRNVIF